MRKDEAQCMIGQMLSVDDSVAMIRRLLFGINPQMSNEERINYGLLLADKGGEL